MGWGAGPHISGCQPGAEVALPCTPWIRVSPPCVPHIALSPCFLVDPDFFQQKQVSPAPG